MKIKYLLERDKFRKKHGKINISKIGEEVNDELVHDMLRLAYHVGEWRGQHKLQEETSWIPDRHVHI